MDFGFNDPKVVVKLGRVGKTIYVQQLYYRRGVVREDFIEELKRIIPESARDQEQYADSADPESIEAIYRAGFNIHPADKGQGSVQAGIETVNSYDLAITADSVDVQRDVKNCKYKKDKNGNLLDARSGSAVITHAFSHGCDAIRYPVHTHWGKEYSPDAVQASKATDSDFEQMEIVSMTGRY
jgi:phage terminase large subunit